MSRVLHYVPLIHIELDIPEEGRLFRIENIPGYKLRVHEDFVTSYMDKIRDTVLKLDIKRIYLDGWRASDSWDILVPYAQRGSAMAKLVLDMILERDAILEGTEEEILRDKTEELYRRLRFNSEEQENILEQVARLTVVRDLFMRRRVKNTLLEGEVGILFTGAAHLNPAHQLNYGDIDVREIYSKEKLIRDLREQGKWGRGFADAIKLQHMFSEVILEEPIFKELDKEIEKLEDPEIQAILDSL
jgi:hypothetical protein